ncbi:MAG: hypothetical protein ABSH08_01740 [Tepidisphaeraceae bacterium]
MNKILQNVATLNDQELQELRKLLENRSARQATSTPAQKLRDALVQRGLLEKLPPRFRDPDRYRRWQPIPVQGKPLSQTIIEERR